MEYLENRDIKVKFWDKDSRKELLNIISGTKNSVIENCRKQYEKLPGVLKESLVILNSLSKECIKEGQNALGIFAFGFGVSIVQELIFVSKDHFDVLSQVCSDLWQGRKLPNFSLKNGLEILKNNASKYKQMATNVFNSKLTLISYGAATALKLLNSIKSCTEIKDRSEQIKDFKETYEIIKNDYDTQIKRINDILEQKEYQDTLISFESLKICLEIIRGCSGRIKNLIEEIKKTIVENEKNKSKQIFELVISTIQTTVGIAGGKLSTGGNKIFYYGLGAINGVNCILNTVSLASIVNDISDLEELLKNSKELETEINQKIEELIELFNGFNGISPTFYEKINQKKLWNLF